MPSLLLGQPLASGAQIIVSGFPWSGQIVPQGGVQLRWVSSGGNAYIGLSGAMTITSGAMFLSGGPNSGLLDGMVMAPGDSYFVPRSATGLSGRLNIFALCDGVASGIGRLFFEVFNLLFALFIGASIYSV